MIHITPLEAWIREKIGINADAPGDAFVKALEAYQLQRFNETIAWARRCSPFYRRHLALQPEGHLSAISEISRLPFTTSADLAVHPMHFLAVRQDDITKIVTLRTSGSTGDAKRIFFTEADLEPTVDFFHHGMSTLVCPEERVAILIPGDKPDSVGGLLRQGLLRMDVQTLMYGPVADSGDAAHAINTFGAHALVGIPTQILSVALSPEGATIGKNRIKSVLLSTDYVPHAISETLEAIWGCRVFTHYGMTEMGFGGGVECEALDGYHLRECDLYVEVVNRQTGDPCASGVMGEVVFTTLNRQGMPLIRYRTGDIARILPHDCPCGSVLRRLEQVRGRWDGAVSLIDGAVLTLPDMDDALFRLPGLLDYRACVSMDNPGLFDLHVDVYRISGSGPADGDVHLALQQIEAIRQSVACKRMKITITFSPDGRWRTTGMAKRKLFHLKQSL